MKMNKGVEWAVHACTLLAPLGQGRGLSLSALADYHGVPVPYMAKQMQLLSKAGIVSTSRGQTGGYTLAKAPAEISLWDIKQAVDGATPAFRCTEIRQNGPCAVKAEDCVKACPIAAAFAAAEAAYREALQSVRLSDLVASVSSGGDTAHMLDILRWYEGHVTDLPGGVL